MFRYEQRTGRFLFGISDSPRAVAVGYAGAPPCINDPSQDHVKKCGPIPSGEYVLVETHHPRFAAPAFYLAPEKGNRMHGRSGFWIHGDNKRLDRSASTGCIILDRATRIAIRAEIGRSADLPVLEVVP